MEVASAVFTVAVVLAFLGSAYDHWLFAQGVLNRRLRFGILLLFTYTESFLAVTEKPEMWLYAALNVWAIGNLVFRRASPIPVVGRPRVPNPFSGRWRRRPGSSGSRSES